MSPAFHPSRDASIMLMYVQRKNDYVQTKNDTLHPTTLEAAPLLHLARKEGSWKREPATGSTGARAVNAALEQPCAQ
jgi:hypothetical protein